MPEKDNSVDYSKMRFSSLGGKTIVQDKDVNSGNNKKFSDYFSTDSLQFKITQPFIITNTEKNYDIKIIQFQELLNLND